MNAGYFVRLEAVGNPDHGENPDAPLPGVPRKWAAVGTIGAAQTACLEFIAAHGLGGGNWSGGEILDADRITVVGSVSYNGRFWPNAAKAPDAFGRAP